MKRTLSLFLWLIVFSIYADAQERPKGAVLLGGSLSSDISSSAWNCRGSVVGGVFLLKNFAVGTEVTLSIDKAYHSAGHNSISPSLFARYHLPFFTPIFLQIGYGSTFYSSTINSPRVSYWYPRLGFDIDILKTIILEWSVSRYFVSPEYSPAISTNLSFLILLNNRTK